MVFSLQLALKLLQLVHSLQREGSRLCGALSELRRWRSFGFLLALYATWLVPLTIAIIVIFVMTLFFSTQSFFELFLLFYVLLDTFKLVLKSCQKLRITVGKELAVLVFLLHAIEPD